MRSGACARYRVALLGVGAASVTDVRLGGQRPQGSTAWFGWCQSEHSTEQQCSWSANDRTNRVASGMRSMTTATSAVPVDVMCSIAGRQLYR